MNSKILKKTNLTLVTLVVVLLGPGGGTLSSYAEFRSAQLPATDPGRKLRTLSLSKASVIGGNNLSALLTLEFVAPKGGTIVSLSMDPPFNPEGGNAAFVTSSVTVPQGEASATVEVTTFPVELSRQVTIRATAGGVTKTVGLTVEPVVVAGFVINPSSGEGPFNARAAVTLNAPAVRDNTDVTLTSSNPNVVGFGVLGNQPSTTVRFQRGERSLVGIPVRARSVQQTTTVIITATLNGSTQSRPVTVRPIT